MYALHTPQPGQSWVELWVVSSCGSCGAQIELKITESAHGVRLGFSGLLRVEVNLGLKCSCQSGEWKHQELEESSALLGAENVHETVLPQVEVDLGLNAAANARARHEARKKAAAKQRKTLGANARALAAAEAKTQQQLQLVRHRALTNTR